MIRPSVMLELELEKDAAAAAMKGPMTRAFSYVAPIAVKAGQGPYATLRMNVRLPRAYWPGAGEGADAMWDDVMLPWLRDKLYKVDAVVVNYNKHVHEHDDEPTLRASSITVALKDVEVQLNLDADGRVMEGAAEAIDRYRTLVASGELKDVMQVEMPARLEEAASEGTPVTGEGAGVDGAAQVQAQAQAAPEPSGASEADETNEPVGAVGEADAPEAASPATGDPAGAAEPSAASEQPAEAGVSVAGVEVKAEVEAGASATGAEVDETPAHALALPPLAASDVWRVTTPQGTRLFDASAATYLPEK